MATLENYNLPDEIFSVPAKPDVVHSVLKQQLANRRQGNASTLTRAEVRGGGKKPWSQKGTGRARSGSIRSPLWNGGGVTFGPKRRDYSFNISKKVRSLALKMMLSDKLKSNRLKIVDGFSVDGAKTKTAAKMLREMGITNGLLAFDNADEGSKRAVRNLKNIKTVLSSHLNIFDLLKYEWLVLDSAALNNLQGKL